MLMAGIMEFVTGSVLWHVYQMRWWDYRDSLINIKGFVCLEGLLLFGTGGVLFLYFAAPKLNSLIIRIPGQSGLPCAQYLFFFSWQILLFPYSTRISDSV